MTTTDAHIQQLVEMLRSQIRRREWDLIADCAQIRELSVELVTEASLDRHSASADFAAVWAQVSAFGVLQEFLDDDDVEEVWVNADDRVFISRGGSAELTCAVMTQPELSLIIERMLRHSRRRVDARSPFVDATLPDGSRVHAVIPTITASSIALNVRKFPRRAYTLGDLRDRGALTSEQFDYLSRSLARGETIVVSGATNTGKTTMVRAMLGSLPAVTRVITCEEVFELAPDVVDVVSMQTRMEAIEGGGEIPLRRLVVEALRMRPDVLVIGEVRQAEAFELLIALNSGVRGFCTIHANSASQALRKLITLPLLAGSNVTSQFVVPAIADSVDVVVHMHRDDRGRRNVTEILEVVGWDAMGIKTRDAMPAGKPHQQGDRNQRRGAA